jgi:3D (Asp-Asp-Asp) domain-containing protein
VLYLVALEIYRLNHGGSLLPRVTTAPRLEGPGRLARFLLYYGYGLIYSQERSGSEMDAKKTVTWGEALLGEGREKRKRPEGLALLLHLPRAREEDLEWVEDRRSKAGGLRIGALTLAIFLVTAMVVLPASIDGSRHRKRSFVEPHRVTVTAYTNVEACTDSTPNETASLLKIKPRHYGRIIALSRDLAGRYEFGDRFELQLNGKAHVVEYQDVMAKRFKNRIDLLLPSVKKSLRFGINEGVLVPLGKEGKAPARRMG